MCRQPEEIPRIVSWIHLVKRIYQHHQRALSARVVKDVFELLNKFP